MSNIKVTQEQIDSLIENAVIDVKTVFEKCTLVTVQLENGFVLTESSACVDKANFDEKIGYDICINRIKNKLWELEGYKLQSEVFVMDAFMKEILEGNYDEYDTLRYEYPQKRKKDCPCDICDGGCEDER